jgi:azurin
MAKSLSRRQFASLAFLSAGALAACQDKSATPSPPVDLLLETNGDLLEFKQKELSCHAGDHVRLTFRNASKYVDFEHNFVLIERGTFDSVVASANAAGEARGWMPRPDWRILAFTPMCGRGQVMVTEFVAPRPGDYPFICTFPGHAQSMWGVLHVLPG